jgi:hypothetical protein
VLLGGLALNEPQIAGALAVVVTIILASRTKVHDWINNLLTDEEIRDGLVLLAAALVILPLLPEKPIDQWGVFDLRKLWTLAVLVMAINGLGYIAVRALGAKVGLALAGLFSGFVSSTATIGAMGSRAKTRAELRGGAVAGAAASSVATVVQLGIVVGLVSIPTLKILVPSLLLSGLAALGYAALFTLRSVRETTEADIAPGRPFSPKTALLFVLVVGAALAVSTALTTWLGDNGLLLATAGRRIGRLACRSDLGSVARGRRPDRSQDGSGGGADRFQHQRDQQDRRGLLARRPPLRIPAAAGNRLDGAGCVGRMVREILAGMTTTFEVLARRFPAKRAFITGASSGLGLELARALGRDGWKLGLFDRNVERLSRVEEELSGSGFAVLAYPGDVTNADELTVAVNSFAATQDGLELDGQQRRRRRLRHTDGSVARGLALDRRHQLHGRSARCARRDPASAA